MFKESPEHMNISPSQRLGTEHGELWARCTWGRGHIGEGAVHSMESASFVAYLLKSCCHFSVAISVTVTLSEALFVDEQCNQLTTFDSMRFR